MFEAGRRARRWTAPTTGIGEMRGKPFHTPQPILALLAAICGMVLAGCESSDTVPPADAELDLVATPATLDSSAPGVPESILRARVTNLGVSLPGQTVVFSTSEGNLTPQALTPVETNQFGIAETLLKTTRTATVTARSGGAMDTVTITVISGTLNDILLVSPDVTVNDCNEILRLTATAISTNGLPISNLIVSFEMRNGAGTPGTMGTFVGTFVPSQGVTDINGEVNTQFLLDVTTCVTNCANGGNCEGAVVAVDQTLTFASLPVVILDGIP